MVLGLESVVNFFHSIIQYLFGPPQIVGEGEMLVARATAPGDGGTDPEDHRVSSSSARDSDRASTSGGVSDTGASSHDEVAPTSEVEAPVPVRNIHVFCMKPTVTFGLFFIGWTSTLFCHRFFKIGKWLIGAGVIIYTFFSVLGLVYRHSSILRTTPTVWKQSIFIVMSIGLTMFVGVSFETTEGAISGFMLIGLATFCWTQIAQPCFDYGVLQLVTCIPMQIVILKTKKGDSFKPWYVFTGVVPLVCLLSQAYFVRHFNDRYQQRRRNNIRHRDAI